MQPHLVCTILIRLNIASKGSGYEICQIIGQNQARINFFIEIAIWGADFALHPWGSYGG